MYTFHILTACFLVSTSLAAPRSRTSFDFDWRFLLGNPSTGSCNSSAFSVNVSGVQCLELTNNPATNAPACEDACCSQGQCLLWQYNPSAGCWLGDNCDSNLTNPGWVGAARPASPVVCELNTPCDPNYDDSAWRTLSVPHDFIIEANFSDAYDPNHGALPRNVSWYRKHFSLPPAWSAAESLVWLTFDGVFRAADVYINGAFILHHEEGYTTWHAYLHNASAPLVWGGGENVLAVFVDATQAELWGYEGGGIFRHVWLESAGLLSATPFGLYVPSYVAIADISSPNGADGPQTASNATVSPQVRGGVSGKAVQRRLLLEPHTLALLSCVSTRRSTSRTQARPQCQAPCCSQSPTPPQGPRWRRV